MLHKLFIHSPRYPLRTIKEMECQIKVCEKTTWAVENWGNRHLLGTSAFYTRAAAERSKYGALCKLATLNFWRTRKSSAAARKQIKEYLETGIMK